ncbi:MAG TPA: caspase family protein [Anaerolineales bacterium]|nr:caspase family protein [Anaerolineales bacterium]
MTQAEEPDELKNARRELEDLEILAAARVPVPEELAKRLKALRYRILELELRLPGGDPTSREGIASGSLPAPQLTIRSWYALLIGVSQYDDQNFSPLPNTVNDVSDLGSLLRRAGYKVQTLHANQANHSLLPTRSNILGELSRWAKASGPGDLLWIHFAGHGLYENGKVYLLASDSHLSDLEDTAIDFERFKQIIQDAPAQARVLVLDACHSGIGRSANIMTAEFEERILLGAEGTAILAACRQHERAYEYQDKNGASRNGAFTHFLLEGLKGEARLTGSRFITFHGLNLYVTDQVKTWALMQQHQQTPNAITRLVGDIPLVILEDKASG